MGVWRDWCQLSWLVLLKSADEPNQHECCQQQFIY